MIIARRPVSLLVAGSLAGLLVLTACGSDDGPSAGASSSGTSAAAGDGTGAGEDDGASGGDTCAQLEELDGSPLIFGPVQTFLPRTDLLADVEEKLTPLQAVTPPAEVADAWAAHQGWLEALQAAAEPLAEGGRISDPALLSPGGAVAEGQQALTDWWFDTCS